MKTYTAILKITTSLEQLAAECLNLFGEGARLDSQQVETVFSLCNTPVQSDYIRVVVAEHIASTLQWMKDNNITSENAELIKVEWFGQDIVETEEGLVEEFFQIGTQDVLNELDEVVGTYPVYLGRIG